MSSDHTNHENNEDVTLKLTSPLSNPTLLKVLTYNLFLRPPLISQPKGDFKSDRLSLFIETVLPKYDLIALQESFTAFNSRVQTLVKHARSNGFETCCLGPKSCWYKFHLVDSGLVILSKWPVVTTKTCVFESGVSADRLSAKGVLYTKLKHPTQSTYLHVFNTHLQASYSLHPSATDASVKCRSMQVKTLVNFIQTILASEKSLLHPILVLGDFNIDKLDPDPHEYRCLIDALKMEKRFTVIDVLASSEPACTHRSWHEPNEVAHLDYIFLLLPHTLSSSPPSCQLVDAQIEPFEIQEKNFPRLSDHLAISATFSFPFINEPSPNSTEPNTSSPT